MFSCTIQKNGKRDKQESQKRILKFNELQYTDGQNIVNINWDDAAGFRLETSTTSKQYTTPTLENQPILTTRTDFVNKHPSALQNTS